MPGTRCRSRSITSATVWSSMLTPVTAVCALLIRTSMRPKASDRLAHRIIHLVIFGAVRYQSQMPGPFDVVELRARLIQRLLSDVGDRDGSTRLEQGRRHSLADATCCSGDDSDLPVQFDSHSSSPPRPKGTHAGTLYTVQNIEQTATSGPAQNLCDVSFVGPNRPMSGRQVRRGERTGQPALDPARL